VFASPWLVAAAIAAAALLAVVLYALISNKPTPERQERLRRLAVNASGRLRDAVITEVRTSATPCGGIAHWLDYTYDLNGVGYSATQDITALLAHIDRNPRLIAGPASVKYLPANPSNSIVICEHWSGLR